MLRPHDRKNAELCESRLSAHDFEHRLVLSRRQAVAGDEFRRDWGGVGHAAGVGFLEWSSGSTFRPPIRKPRGAGHIRPMRPSLALCTI